MNLFMPKKSLYVSLLPACIILLLLSGCSYNRISSTKEFERVKQYAQQKYNADVAYQAYLNEPDDAPPFNIPELIKNGITRSQAEKIALMNNLDLQAAFQELGIAQGDLIQAGLYSNPRVEMSLLRERSEILGQSIDVTASLSVSDLWRVPFRTKASEAKLATTMEKIFTAIYDTIVKVRQQYHACLLYQEELSYLHHCCSWLKEQTYNVEEYAHNLVHYYLDKDENFLMQNQKNAHLQLQRTLNLPICNELLKLTDTLETLNKQVDPIDQLIQRRVESWPAVRMAELKVLQAKRVVDLEKVNGYPDIEVGYNYSLSRPYQAQYGFYVGSTIPVFNRNQGTIAQAYAQVDAEYQRYQAVRQDFERDILIAYNTYVRAQNNKKIEEERTKVFNTVLEAVDRKQNTKPLLEATLAQTFIDRYESRKEQINSLAQALDAVAIF